MAFHRHSTHKVPARPHFSSPKGVAFFASNSRLSFALACAPCMHVFFLSFAPRAFECVRFPDVRERKCSGPAVPREREI